MVRREKPLFGKHSVETPSSQACRPDDGPWVKGHAGCNKSLQVIQGPTYGHGDPSWSELVGKERLDLAVLLDYGNTGIGPSSPYDLHVG